MAWLRMGDTAAMHPNVLGVLEHDDADDRLLNEVFGFVVRCATQAAAHQTDYIVTVGTARALAGMSRYKELVATAVACGLMARVEVPSEDGGDPAKALKLIQDPDLLHLRLKKEIEWDRQRDRDVSNRELTGPVRARDGDACRYCGKTVNWADRKGGRGGTYDHVNPGEAATVETMVVACYSCNASRKDNPESKTLRPVPATPIISPSTAKWLTEKCGIPTEPTYQSKAELAEMAKASVAPMPTAPAEADQAPSGTPEPEPEEPADEVPEPEPEPELVEEPQATEPAEEEPADPEPTEPEHAADLTNEQIAERALARVSGFDPGSAERRRRKARRPTAPSNQPPPPPQEPWPTDDDEPTPEDAVSQKPRNQADPPYLPDTSRYLADISRSQQISTVGNPGFPGRVGTGRAGQEREGPGRDGTGLGGSAGQPPTCERARPQRRRPDRSVPSVGKQSKKRKRKRRGSRR